MCLIHRSHYAAAVSTATKLALWGCASLAAPRHAFRKAADLRLAGFNSPPSSPDLLAFSSLMSAYSAGMFKISCGVFLLSFGCGLEVTQWGPGAPVSGTLSPLRYFCKWWILSHHTILTDSGLFPIPPSLRLCHAACIPLPPYSWLSHWRLGGTPVRRSTLRYDTWLYSGPSGSLLSSPFSQF